MSGQAFNHLLKSIDHLLPDSAAPATMPKVALASVVGHRSSNQDRLGHWAQWPWWCAVLSDGAGGHRGGDLAATAVVDAVLSAFAAQPNLNPSHLRDLVVQANEHLLKLQSMHPECADMHATLVAVFGNTQTGQLTVLHSGDSRAYVFEAGQVMWRTADHSWIERWRRSGMTSDPPLQAGALYTALGEHSSQLDMDIHSMPAPQGPGAAVLLCSDGLWGRVSDNALFSQVQHTLVTLPLEVEGLVNWALHASSQPSDNISAVLVCL